MKTIAADADKAGAAWIVTTEKDIMRLRGFDLPENLVALAIEFSVERSCMTEFFSFFIHSLILMWFLTRNSSPEDPWSGT
jgi:tetraacyldisaccharide-1-P 4'-kinase